MVPDVQEQERKHSLPLWVRLAMVISVLLLTGVGAVLWIIQGSWASIPTVLFAVLTVLLTLFQLLPSLFPSGRHGHSTMLPPQLTSDGEHLSPASPLFQPSAPPAQTYPPGITGPPQNLTDTTIQHHEQVPQETAMSGPKVNWDDAPHITQFYGREHELAQLEQWIADDCCHLVAVLGFGGIGKTALVAKLAERIQDKFEHVFWRSLQNAPPLEHILKKSTQFFSQQEQIDVPEDLDGQISLLLQYLRRKRCLLILDNFETVLQTGNRAGYYRKGYEGYGRFIQRIGEGKHQSCILLTSREKPKEIAHLEGKKSPVRSLSLSGLEQKEGLELLKDRGLFGSEEAWVDLIHLYSGNPLALTLASVPIRELFEGNVAEFLKEGEVVVGNIYDLFAVKRD